MTTAELSKLTGVPVYTIRRLAVQLDGIPVGGRHGYEFPERAPQWLRAELRKRHARVNRGPRKSKEAKR